MTAAAKDLRFLPGRVTANSFIGFSSLDSAELSGRHADADADPDYPLYGRSVCFTGAMASMTRSVAADLVCAAGADFKNIVSKRLSYLVIGDGDFVAFADGWSTGKLTKARTLIADGAGIEVIPERDFLAFLGPH